MSLSHGVRDLKLDIRVMLGFESGGITYIACGVVVILNREF